MRICRRQYCALMHVFSKRNCRVWLTRQQDLGAILGLKAGDDEKADANRHNIFNGGDQQVRNFERFH